MVMGYGEGYVFSSDVKLRIKTWGMYYFNEGPRKDVNAIMCSCAVKVSVVDILI